MIEELKPYDSYKSPGLRWAEHIPSHWEVDRARSCLQKLNLRSREGREELLTVSSARGVVPRKSATVTMFKAKSYAGYKLCWPDDLVINSLWAWAGGLGVSRHHGIVSSAYGVYRSRPSSKLHPRYLHELVRSAPFNWELQVRSKGIWISRLQLSDDSFLAAPVLVPPPEEQEAIVRFLDHANRRIDQFIRSKKKLIALLNEQKQAIIHRAVTRGLDPNVKMKDSGVPWLGPIPAHWVALELRAVAEVIDPNPSHRNPTYTTNGFPFVSTVEFTGTDDIELNTPRRVALSTVIEQEQRCRFRLGSIAFSRKGTIGAVRILPHTVRFALLDSVCVINPGPRVDYRYLYRQLSAQVITAQLGWLVRGAALKQVSVGRVRRARVVVPPFGEQQRIAAAVEEASGPLNDALSRAEKQVALAAEFRTRLVSDVVTGQLDVRAAAASLPDIEPEAAPSTSDEDEDEDETDIDDGEAA